MVSEQSFDELKQTLEALLLLLEKGQLIPKNEGTQINDDGSITYEVETSVTLEYRSLQWGIESIVRDGLSNHLPEDSKGKRAGIRLKQNGVWYNMEDADRKAKTEEIIFEDDGSGYTTKKLSTLRSNKMANALSVGQFGEGLKLAAAAALRLGQHMEYRSRNWIAVPFAKEEFDDGERYELLCFRITENGVNTDGSRTAFRNPSQELVDEVFCIPEKVLHFKEEVEEEPTSADEYRVLHSEKDNVKPFNSFATQIYISISEFNLTQEQQLKLDMTEDIIESGNVFDFPQIQTLLKKYNSRIIKMGGKKEGDTSPLFVKGVKVQHLNSLFSYDIGLDNITPDRIFADDKEVIDTIESLLKGCANEEVIETVLREAHEHPGSYRAEIRAFNPHRNKNPEKQRSSETKELVPTLDYTGDIFGQHGNTLWAKKFSEMFDEEGEDGELREAVIASTLSLGVNKDAELLSYKVIKIDEHVGRYLAANGVKTAKEVAQQGVSQEYRWVDPEEYTDEERAILTQLPALTEILLEGGEVPEEKRTADVRIYSGLYTNTWKPSGVQQ